MTMNAHQRIRILLEEGYGVEDISIKTGLPLARIRSNVALMRAAGVLQEIYKSEDEE